MGTVFFKYYDTLKYVKLSQLFNRVIRNFRKINIDFPKVKANNKIILENWIASNLSHESFFEDGSVCFLNKQGNAYDWHCKDKEKLWLYNLHYFDDLSSGDFQTKRTQHFQWVNDWIENNPPMMGDGWEPYPLSLRIVNWVKWSFNSGGALPEKVEKSLALQAHVLSQTIEYHLLGNHIVANAKALIFAGVYFEGKQAELWLETGRAILSKELREQVLRDGGNFELSPMYHAIMLHDVLDLINTSRASSNFILSGQVDSWLLIANKMLKWLEVMTHKDDEVSFFNDSAMGIAPSLSLLSGYAERLGVKYTAIAGPVTHLADSGYIRVSLGAYNCLIDVAKIGPDYLPGHGHADVLSFELSLGKQRVIVNSGTSVYGVSEERLRQRKTKAHSTVEVNDADSSEVWSGFRVAKRAYPSTPAITDINGGHKVSCSHDGYNRLGGGATHSRAWEFLPYEVSVVDSVNGNTEKAVAYYHLHPDIVVKQINEQYCQLILPDESFLNMKFSDGTCKLLNSTWHPKFGVSIKNKCLAVHFKSHHLKMTITGIN